MLRSTSKQRHTVLLCGVATMPISSWFNGYGDDEQQEAPGGKG